MDDVDLMMIIVISFLGSISCSFITASLICHCCCVAIKRRVVVERRYGVETEAETEIGDDVDLENNETINC
jgi:hypothetical protein